MQSSTVAVVFLSLLALAYAADKIMCYSCTSVGDPDCEAEFDEKTYEKFKVDCSSSKEKPSDGDKTWKPSGCRKILQEVNDEDRIVRQCAYSGEDVDGFKRTGNEGVRMWYYQCSDGDFCNSASGLGAFSLLFTTALALFLH